MLSVASRPIARQTGHMALDALAKPFVRSTGVVRNDRNTPVQHARIPQRARPHPNSYVKGNRMKEDNTKEQQTTRRTRLIACVTALGMAFTIALPHAAHAQTVTPPPVPAGLEVPAGNVAFLLGRGVGTQNYECQPSGSIGRVAWILFTPQATLFSDQQDQLTTHFFSPNPVEGVTVRATWQDSRDTSTVWAKAIATAADPNASGAIDWVKLQTVGTQAGPTGGTTLSGTTFVQRVNTVGGSAPATGCALPTDIGHKAFVPYTADYVFYKKQS
jgi:hypothetical protein